MLGFHVFLGIATWYWVGTTYINAVCSGGLKYLNGKLCHDQNLGLELWHCYVDRLKNGLLIGLIKCTRERESMRSSIFSLTYVLLVS